MVHLPAEGFVVQKGIAVKIAKFLYPSSKNVLLGKRRER